MARRPCTFKQQDLTRALRGVIAAGMKPTRVQIDKQGTITISESAPKDPQAYEAELDQELAAFTAEKCGST
jgi:hypothetical protein